ncbi:hydroxymethylbilane synthase [Paenibacillus yanchengensis]|uniref:Porphobilinogen deaminase n=1 Tax=Paenibacillus yanchengensis TaxID=2035833 RepID=A0ABW4YLT7_9BACL
MSQNAWRVIKVGTRQSQLALTQTGQVIDQLNDICIHHRLNYRFEVHKIVTKGDKILDVSLSKVGGKGLFVKEIEQALLDGVIDLAVHSMKDMPYEQPTGLMNGATPKRLSAQDCLVMKEGITSFADLPVGAKVGTSSLRRSCQLKYVRPDLQIEFIRGNIDSRIRKLHTEDLDAVVLAAAGLMRMGWEDKISAYIAEDICVPAVGQGALGIQCRESDEQVRALLQLLNDEQTEITVRAERSFLGAIEGSCQVPIGAQAILVEEEASDVAELSEQGTYYPLIELTAIVGSTDGSVLLKEVMRGRHPEQLGEEIAAQLLASGADRILAEVNLNQ